MKKKVLLMTIMLVAAWVGMSAAPRAIGGRIGYGVEFSYEHGLGESNMISIDAGLPGFNGLHAVGTYDWIFNIKSWSGKGEWNWYPGVGAGVGIWDLGDPNFLIGVAGRIGIEYNFWFPLQLSLDYRPVIGIAGSGFYDQGLISGIDLGIRYRF
ncbi:MAG: hypothetical protein IJ680_05340 [Paludibacteraceae bacterium]|nr:hypothetical protein [Paludibacteraceae bacterium]